MRRSQPFEIKLADEKTGSFEGIASVYGNVDSYGDVVQAGAFAKTISERGRNVPILWQHDSRLPIGTGEVFDAGDHLGIKGRIIDSVSYGADALKLIREGVVKGLSIGYSVVKDQWDSDRKLRLLNEIKLYEVSVVTFPANELAVLTGVKGDQQDELYSVLTSTIEDVKAGRVLSAASIAKVEAAIETLQALLAEQEAAKNQKPGEPREHSLDVAQAIRDLRKAGLI